MVFLDPLGTVQGGILAAMLDDTMGPATAAVHRGRDVVFLEGSLTDAEGRLVATASATARVIPSPRRGR